MADAAHSWPAYRGGFTLFAPGSSVCVDRLQVRRDILDAVFNMILAIALPLSATSVPELVVRLRSARRLFIRDRALVAVG
jgi:hypothetical protein